MSKYIIEIEDEPFVRLSALFREEGLYRAKGFKSLVFDKFGLDKLTPLDKALEEAYLQGRHDAEQDLARAAYKEAYQKGYDEAKLIYQNPNAESDYQRGLNDAWEAAKKICTNWMISDRVLAEIFGQCKDIDTIMHENTAQEAINKLKTYEEQRKADAEIKVGDEVCFVFAGGETIEPFIVFSIKDDNGKKYYEGIQTSDGRWVGGGLKYYKTGRHFPQVAELFKAIKGERSCSSCEYSNDPDGVRCRDCCGYNKWQPKEGAE